MYTFVKSESDKINIYECARGVKRLRTGGGERRWSRTWEAVQLSSLLYTPASHSQRVVVGSVKAHISPALVH